MNTAAYTRVSTGHQTIEQQRDAIAARGLDITREFTDTASGRAGADRPGWRECLDWLRDGDTLVVAAVDRIGRSVREVAEALYQLTERNIALVSLREGVDTSTPTGRAVVQIMSSIAELELELGKERRAASRETRTQRGLPATKPPKLSSAQRERLVRMYRSGEPVSEVAATFEVSRATVFRYVKAAV